MIKEAKRLHKLGLAIHWLKPNSKEPLGAWRKGGRKRWQELKDSYRYGLNIGVKLGKASRFEDGTYLAVIDCDVKSELPTHLAEMEKALEKHFGDKIVGAPMVASGRGNGSCHIYVRTKEPLAPFRLTSSKEKVRVEMPSVDRVSPQERKALKPHELKAGVRLRSAWEISIMGEGQQVVLPPSIHPDSGQPYEWRERLTETPEMPLMDFKRPACVFTTPIDEGLVPFKSVDVDLIEDTRLPHSTVDLIMSGEDCEDRSASLFTVAIQMVKAGFSDNEILSVLTNTDYFLGQAAYEHTNSTSRRRAAEWVRRYTLTKVKSELDAANLFTEIVDISDAPEIEIEPDKSSKKKGDNIDWKNKIERAGEGQHARPKPTLKNVHLIITNEAHPQIFRRNEFAHTDHYTSDAPWGGKKGQEVGEADPLKIKFWLSQKYRFEPNTQLVLEAIQTVAHTNRHHPVRDFVRGLKWDGVERLDNWLETYLGAKGPRDYLQAVGRKTLTAMVARIEEPGVKFDTVLVLEGRQGCGKSSAVRMLADPWFSDAMINIGDKDAVMAMRLAWVMELGELSSMRKADIDQLKQFISQPVDRIRVPYGRLTESFPRQSIFIGTTNSSEYLKDTTGNRRFWPVRVTQCDFDALKRDRKQLLAEAAVGWALGENLWLDDAAVEKTAMEEQASRVFEDAWVGVLLEFFARKKNENFPMKKFAIQDLFSDFGPFPGQNCNKGEQMRAGDALRVLGFERKRTRTKRGNLMLWSRQEVQK